MQKLALSLLISSISIISFAQNWQTDFKIAKTLALNENKKIVMVFQGSDWCGPCIKLDKEIWSSEEFIKYASDNYVMLKVDFPRRKQNLLSKEQQNKNEKLADMYNPHGHFPLVLVFDSKGNLKGKTGYKQISPKMYIEMLNGL